MFKILNVFYFIFVFSQIIFCSGEKNNEEIAYPFITNYSPDEYKEGFENWCILQDKRGIMYFGNNNGILEYDGNSWRLIKTLNGSNIRSLAMDDEGRIYVAASSEFGYLAPDSVGELKYISLLENLENKYHDFGDVWDIAFTQKAVFFKTRDKIFRWDGDKIKVFESVIAYRLYKYKNEIFVRSLGRGLLKIAGDSLAEIPDGNKFSSLGIYNIIPFGNKALITTTTEGLYLYDGIKFTPFITEADSFLRINRLYNTCRLQDNRIAFATQNGGIIIIDQQGKIRKVINSQNGLSSDVIYNVFQDKEGALWAAMKEGIARIEISSPFSLLPKTSIYNDFISDMYRFNGKLYASNSFGLLYFDEKEGIFKAVSQASANGSNFISIGNSLYAATNNEIYRIENERAVEKIISLPNLMLYKSDIDSNRLFAISRGKIVIFNYNNGKLEIKETIEGINSAIASIIEAKDGCLWVFTYYKGIIRIVRNETEAAGSSRFTFETYNKNNGPPGNVNQIITLSNKVLFITDEGVFNFDSRSKTFSRDYIFGKDFQKSTSSISSVIKNKYGGLWILAETENGTKLGKAIRQKGGDYFWEPNPILKRLNLKDIFAFFPDYSKKDGKEILWISTRHGLVRFDPEVEYNTPGYTVLIRKVIVNNDSLIYGGYLYPAYAKKEIKLPYSKNDIRFEVSAVSFDRTEANLYQYFLEGEDDKWSPWMPDAKRKYSNLSDGKYKFKFRAKNIYGKISGEAEYNFAILPPWYLSWYAYLIYSIFFVGFLYQIRRFELIRLKRKHSFQLQHVEFENLKKLDRLKSQFFANISHEFRTPLTLILGQIESVMSSQVAVIEKGKLQVANRNAKRLLTLINQLLDLSKLEAGSMDLKAEQHNIVSFLKSLFYSFESFAEHQKIRLKFESELENLPVVFDPDKMEKVFYNFISNAIKFTSENGEIKIILNRINSSQIEIKIKDTGKGISKEHLPHIFDRFYQADSSVTKEYEGTGIGLALAKELIELHKGTISVISIEGEGTEFIIYLPVGDYNLEKENLVALLSENPLENYGSGLEEDEENNNPSPAVNKKRTKKNVLIVEDNADVRNYIREQLEAEFIILEASNGIEGIEKAVDKIPDLIITDVMMPKMDGYKFTGSIRKNEKTSHIPIIMLTAKAALDDKIEGLETGIDAYLTKPFSSKELRVRVKNLINQREQLRKRFSKSTVISPSEVSSVSVDQKFIEKTIKIIELNFGNDRFGVEDLSREVNMSVSQLNRKLNALIDQPAGQLIRSIRLQRAADLLIQNSGSIAEICYMVGFNDQAYFSRSFKKQFGCPPSEFKKDEIS